MTDLTLFVGLDVHKKTISVALVDAVAKADVRHDCEHAGYAAQPVQEAVDAAGRGPSEQVDIVENASVQALQEPRGDHAENAAAMSHARIL